MRGGLHLLSALVWLIRTKRPSSRPGASAKRGVSTGEAARDTLRYTLWLAALGASFVAVDEGLAIVLGRQRSAACSSGTPMIVGSGPQP